MVSTFFASFAFFGEILLLPRWFQFVHEFSPTDSGLAALPLMIGLIFSSIGSGLIVSRTGRYKWLLVGAIVVMGVSTALMTQLTADTPAPRSSGSGCSSPARASWTDVLGLHDRGPERGAVQPAWRRYIQPHVLPPDRRHGRAWRSSGPSSARASSSRLARSSSQQMCRRRSWPGSARRPQAAPSTSTS